MPSKSKAQQRFMFAMAKDAKARKRKGISADVVKDFVSADKARGKKKLPERAAKKPPAKAARKPKQSEAAAREFRLRNAKL